MMDPLLLYNFMRMHILHDYRDRIGVSEVSPLLNYGLVWINTVGRACVVQLVHGQSCHNVPNCVSTCVCARPYGCISLVIYYPIKSRKCLSRLNFHVPMRKDATREQRNRTMLPNMLDILLLAAVAVGCSGQVSASLRYSASGTCSR